MTTPTDAQLSAIAVAFETFARRFKMAEALSAGQQLNEVDKQTLFYVAEHPGCGPTDVARFLGVPATTLTSVADRLVRKKFLERARAEVDRRAVALSVSDSGTRQVDALKAAHHDMYRSLLEPLSRVEQDRLVEIMTKIAQHQ